MLLARVGQDAAPITLDFPTHTPLKSCEGQHASGQADRDEARTERPFFSGEFIAAIVRVESRDAQNRMLRAEILRVGCSEWDAQSGMLRVGCSEQDAQSRRQPWPGCLKGWPQL